MEKNKNSKWKKKEQRKLEKGKANEIEIKRKWRCNKWEQNTRKKIEQREQENIQRNIWIKQRENRTEIVWVKDRREIMERTTTKRRTKRINRNKM